MKDIELPNEGMIVNATLQHWYTKGTQQADLVRVNEDDVTWRTADDNSELSYDWDVISWSEK